MFIAIDHGNKNIKTLHRVFTSGLTASDTRPPFGENILSMAENIMCCPSSGSRICGTKRRTTGSSS